MYRSVCFSFCCSTLGSSTSSNLLWRFKNQYYDRQSKHILDTIVETLLKDERRKFIWEEMSYLERWWRDAPDAKKEALVRLLQNGQLEIVGGGWVMNDEANSHYFAIIEQVPFYHSY
ncbi:putative mannosyl-oligosaccharide 1,3-1,6-alpha-mannosidase [Helianthus annuus]|nr:putative mannosyl-oligosaccharide 1,3-1,6-alpha-mannosidase [Helianthus annuus]